MNPNSEIPQNSVISRRRVLRNSAFAGLTLLVGGAVTAATATSAGAAKTKKKPTTTKRKRTVSSSGPATTIATKPVGATAGSFSPAQEMAISWTFAPQNGGGRIHNPFVAVWVEDSSNIAVRVVHLEYQLGRGTRWLNDLVRWERADQTLVALGIQSSADTTTNATRIPGTYAVVWDGKDADGKYVAAGTYNVYVEAAREKGPYQFVKHTINITGEAFSEKATASGELTDVKLNLRAKA
jgi:hypothetical protein